MTEFKGLYSDTQLIFYGKRRGFAQHPYTCLLQDSGPHPDQALLSRTAEKDLSFGKLADYVCLSLMNPQIGLKALGQTEDGFVRFVAGRPFSRDKNAAWGILFKTGEGGYLACENQDTMYEMLSEFYGFSSVPLESDLFLELTPGVAFILLAACDVISQNRYPNGWFSAVSLFNAFHTEGETDFCRLCAPLAEAAGEYIRQELNSEGIGAFLDELVSEDILETDTAEGVQLFTFSPEYRQIIGMFSGCRGRLALLCTREERQNLLYLFSDEAQSWLMSVSNNQAFLRPAGNELFRKELEALLNTETPQASRQRT